MTCSTALFQPTTRGLQRVVPDASGLSTVESAPYYQAISALLSDKRYPCMPAKKSFEHNEYLVGIYDCDIGSGAQAKQVLSDILYFRDQQKASNSLYMSYWAIFTGPNALDEADYEDRMWQELSMVSAHQDAATPWDPNFSSDPRQPNFCPSFGGDAFFIVGMHSKSSREPRRFPFPSIIFNLYEQFEELSRRSAYESTVKTNRTRELKFYGSLNPMVQKWGDKWESIQFSGKNNPDDWQCPFKHEVPR